MPQRGRRWGMQRMSPKDLGKAQPFLSPFWGLRPNHFSAKYIFQYRIRAIYLSRDRFGRSYLSSSPIEAALPQMGRRPMGSEANWRSNRSADASQPRYRPKPFQRQGSATVGPNAFLLDRYPAGTMGNRSESLGWPRSHPARRRTFFLRRITRRIQDPSLITS